MKSNHSKISFYAKKYSVICTILLCFVSVISFGQTNSIKKEDIKFYYVFDSKIIDVRTHKPVLPNLKLEGIPVYFVENKILSLYTGFNNFNYDSFGKNISSFSNTIEYHYKIKSPDYKQHLYSKENDIWIEKINYSNGKSYEEKRLTQFGIFQSIDVVNWFEDNVIFRNREAGGEKVYSINVESGALSEINMDERKSRDVFQSVKNDYVSRNVHSGFDLRSPSGQYFLVLSNDEPDYVYDMKTLTKKDLEYNLSLYDDRKYFWASDTVAIVYSGERSLSQSDNRNTIFWVNLKTRKVGKIAECPDDISLLMESLPTEMNGLSKSFSLNGSYIVIERTGKKMSILDFKSREFIDPEISCSNFEWISDNKLIYKSEGDITTQGTWIYDITKKEKKRLTGFLLGKAVVLQKANKVVFTANEYLFSVDTSGDNLEQISKNKLVYLRDLSEFNFLGISEKLKNLSSLKIDYSQTNLNYSTQPKSVSNNNKEVIKNPSRNEEKKTKSSNPLNSSFNTKEGWNVTNGEAIFEKGKVALTPDKNGIPLNFLSTAFSIPTNASQLKIKIAKNLVGKGEIKISLQNTGTNTTEDIYKDKISNLGSKIGNILLNANKVLDGNVNLTKIEPTFEVITVDISKFAGAAVILELRFTNTGSSKQPILIDEITLN